MSAEWTLLETKKEIKAAIALMDSVSRSTAQNYAAMILENPAALDDEEQLSAAFWSSLLFAAKQANWDLDDEKKVEEFVKERADSISNVALSIVVFTFKQHEKKRKWGWLGKAAAFAGGAVIASFFG